MAENEILPSLDETDATFTELASSLTKSRMMIEVYTEALSKIKQGSGDPHVDIEVEEFKLRLVDFEQMFQDMLDKWEPLNDTVKHLYQYLSQEVKKVEEIKVVDDNITPAESSISS